MQKAVQNMALLYQIAHLLGARTQIKSDDSDVWMCSSLFISSGSDYRVHPDDENILKQAEATFLKTHAKIEFHGGVYYVPINAMDGASLVLFQYCLGVYGTVDKNGNVTELSTKKSLAAEKDESKCAYLSLSEKSVYGPLYKKKK